MRHNIEYSHQKDFTNSPYAHVPVLSQEILGFLDTLEAAHSIYLVDATLGEGGHTEIILNSINNIKIIAFEQDQEILEVAKNRLIGFKNRVEYINDNFSKLSYYLKKPVDFFLYDFGISSYHFDKSERGFAFKEEEFLDMRLNQTSSLKAYDVVNYYQEKKLADIFYTYGEEKWSRKIAAAICQTRLHHHLETTGDLASLVLKVIPKKFQVKNIHPATRVFQALRIEVNKELEAIQKTLEQFYKFLKPGGKILAISFHSLEDRLVKEKFRRLAKGCTCNLDGKFCQCNSKPLLKILTKKPLIPSVEEIQKNKRSRSAKLRVAEKIFEEQNY